MYELSGCDLDAVAAGAANAGAAGLVNVQVPVDVQNNHVLQNFLNNNSVLNNSLDNNTVRIPIGIAAAVLGIAVA